MDNVVPFAPRPSAGGGWTAAERARLSELADRLAEGGAKVEVVYGVTDEGDPWCVIKDDQEEVLIHVARINGQFVIHDASADAIQEGETLWAACDRLLGGDWREARDDVVVSLSARQVQTFIALVVAATFIHEVDDAAAATPPALDQAEPAPAPLAVVAAAAQPASDDVQRQDLLAPQNHGRGEETPPASTGAETTAEASAPQPQQPAAPADDDARPAAIAEPEASVEGGGETSAAPEIDDRGEVIQGGDGDDTLQGGAGDDTIFGGAGADSLMGGAGADYLYGGEGADTLDGGAAPDGRFDLVDGGAGDDQIQLTASTIAIGGAGADEFALKGPPTVDGLMGVVLDFSHREGDRLTFQGKNVNVVSRTEQPDVTQGLYNYTNIPATARPGQRFDIDLDNDGRADGYVLVGHARHEDGTRAPGSAMVETALWGDPDDYAAWKTQHSLDDGSFI